jgi:hypothetical protein
MRIGTKIVADDANAIATVAKTIGAPDDADHAAGAKTRATTVGIMLWKTIAPVMFPIASVSLPLRTRMTLSSFSGSSVAIGVTMRSAGREAAPIAIAYPMVPRG